MEYQNEKECLRSGIDFSSMELTFGYLGKEGAGQDYSQTLGMQSITGRMKTLVIVGTGIPYTCIITIVYRIRLLL